MKFLAVIATVFSLNTFSSDTVDLPQSECVRSCTVFSYSFQSDSLGNCQQIEKCDILSWNEETQECGVVALDQLVSFPIACRDIPAY